MTTLRSRAFIVKQYFQYWLKATDQYSLHSPFTYQFYNEVILGTSNLKDFEEIEFLRKSLLRNHAKIQVLDLGAGSLVNPDSRRSISQIAGSSLSTPKFSSFLFRFLSYFKPGNILELGTSLGINTLYMAKSNPSTPVYTFEGCPNIAAIASNHFHQLKANNVRIIRGNINDTLSDELAKIGTPEFVYFDANHTEEATMEYFERCLRCKCDSSIFIFDDIHLTEGMFNAWEKIRRHKEVTLSMDIFDAGIIFFKEKLQPNHYTLSF